MIRITGGTFLSRKLTTPSTDKTKPTMDRVRAGVFSALQNDITNARVLDMFAGSGAYSFESLSRGASFATLIDKDKDAIKAINDNIKALNVAESTLVVNSDSLEYLKVNKEPFDIIFVDPPYKAFNYKMLVDLILETNSLKDKGIIVLESEDDLDIDETRFSKTKKYKYGLAKTYILRK